MNINSFLALLKNVKPAGTGKWMACCPTHNDGQHQGDQSLSISLKDEKILLKCFAGCQTPDIVKTLGLTMSDLFLGKKKRLEKAPRLRRTPREIEAIYPYHNAGNQLIFEVVRYEPKAFSQRRPDGHGGYINDLKGVERVIYRLPQITAAIQRGEMIVHVEGERDVDNLVKLGFEATTSPQGASNWKSAMAGYYRGADTVVILPDKDAAGRSYAAEVAADLLSIAAHVKVLELPGEGVKDASDWISAGGTRELLEELVKNTPDYKPPVGENGDIDYDAMRKMLKAESSGLYTIIDNRFQHIVRTRDGEVYEQPICNFVARVTEDILKDNGAFTERFLKVQGRLNGSKLPLITIPESQFDNMKWLRSRWGFDVQTEKSQAINDHLIRAITKSSGKPLKRIIYTHTGWRGIDGKMVYLTQGGAIGRPDIEVELPPPLLNKYSLPQPDGSPKDAVAKSMEMLLVADMKITLPAFLLPYLSILNIFEDMTFTSWFVGRSGSLKSTLIALAVSHFGNFTHKNLRVNWFGTRTELEKLSFIAKDIIFPIDDYAPPANPAEARELNKTVEYIIRSYANRQGKVRSNPDMTSQETFYPRGLLVTSGEQLPPPGASRSARILPIPIERSDFVSDGKDDYFLLSQSQKDRRFYPMAMSHYIKWIQDNWDAVDKKFHEYLTENLRAAPKADIHLRLVETISLMQAGYHIFLDFAQSCGVVKDSSIRGSLESGWDILLNLLKYQSGRITAERPGDRFIEVLKSLLSSGKAILRQKGETGNWSPSEGGPGQRIIGWDDVIEGILYLNSEESYSAVFSHCLHIGEFFGATKEATWDDMNSLGYLEATGEEGSRTMLKKKMIAGIHHRLLWVKRKVLFFDDEF